MGLAEVLDADGAKEKIYKNTLLLMQPLMLQPLLLMMIMMSLGVMQG